MTIADLDSYRIYYADIQKLLNEGFIEKIKRGYYHWTVTYGEQEVKIINRLFSDAVICMETALFYYQYSDRNPAEWNITIDKNVSGSRTNIDYPFVKAYRVEPAFDAIVRGEEWRKTWEIKRFVWSYNNCCTLAALALPSAFGGFPALAAIIHRAHSLNPAEALGKIAGGGEAKHAGDLGEGHAGLRQEVQALLNPAGQKIIDRRRAVFPAEGMDQIVLAYMGYGGQIVQGQAFFEMIIDITAHYGAFLAGLMDGRHESDGKLAAAHEQKQHDLQ